MIYAINRIIQTNTYTPYSSPRAGYPRVSSPHAGLFDFVTFPTEREALAQA